MRKTKEKKEKTVTLITNVPEHIALEIDARCGGKSGGGRHVKAGRSLWMTEVIYEKLGFPLPVQPEGPASETDIDVRYVDVNRVDCRTGTIVTLYRQGLPLREIVAYLREKNIPTPRGGSWDRRRVHATLKSAERRAAKEQAKKRGVSVS